MFLFVCLLIYLLLSSFSAAQVPRLNFEPTPEFPALQYFGHVEEGGQAALKGVRAGDFILEVSYEPSTKGSLQLLEWRLMLLFATARATLRRSNSEISGIYSRCAWPEFRERED